MRKMRLGLFALVMHVMTATSHPTDMLGIDPIAAALDVVSSVVASASAAATATATADEAGQSYGAGSGTIKPLSTLETPSTYSLICEQKYESKLLWDYYDMKTFMTEVSDQIPVGYESSFLQYVIQQVENMSRFNCFSLAGGDSTDCSFPGFSTFECESGGKDNPRYYFILQSIKYFHDWVMRLHGALGDAGTEITGLSTKMATDFSETKFPDNDSWIATMMSGIFGVASGGFATLLTQVGKTAVKLGDEVTKAAKTAAAAKDSKASDFVLGISGMAGVSGGATTIGNGIANGLLGSAADVIQNEINTMRGLEIAITKGTQMLQEAVIALGNEIINGIAVNDPDNKIWYSNSPTGAVQIFRDGLFSTPPPAEEKNSLTTGIQQAYYAAAVSTIWQGQEMFVARLTSAGIYDGWDETVCELFKENPGAITSDQTSLFCDGDTAYFFMRKSATPTDGSGYLPVNGADNAVLETYKLDLLTIAKSAEWTQANFGFGSGWNNDLVSDIILKKGNVDIGIYMGIPFLDLDQFRGNSDIWPEPRYTGGHCNSECQLQWVVDHVAYLQNTTINGKLQRWPYKNFYPPDSE